MTMRQNTKEWTVLRMMEWATGYFGERGVDQPRLSIEWLLAHVLDVPRLNLYLQFDRPLAEAELAELRELVRRRARHEPLQYITGTGAFYGREFQVGPGVLIPRPETEELVGLCLRTVDSAGSAGWAVSEESPSPGRPPKVLDLGTGSGCIAITLALEIPGAQVHAVDVSAQALEIAQANAKRLGAEVAFHKGDLLRMDRLDVQGPWDVIASNPPYVLPSEAESLDPQVREHEPHLALFHPRPLELIASMLAYAASTLRHSGRLVVELNPMFADQALELARMHLPHSRLESDLAGRPRFLVGEATTANSGKHSA